MPADMGVAIKYPSFVMSAFACELLIKGMLKDEKIPRTRKGHNLNTVFGQLRGKTKNAIIKKVADKINAREKAELETEFQCCLAAINQNDASSPEQKTRRIKQLTEQHKKDIDKDATVTVTVTNELGGAVEEVKKAWFGGDEFYAELKKHKNAFTDWRYAHETGPKSYYPKFMELFQESIMEFCEENNIFDNKSPDF